VFSSIHGAQNMRGVSGCGERQGRIHGNLSCK
jgi:hypothetical protein